MPSSPHEYLLEPQLEIAAVPPDCLPTLDAYRVRLRWIERRDLADLFALFADPEVTRFWPWPALVTPAQAETLIGDIRAGFEARRLLQWGVARREDDRLIGTCMLASLDRRHRRAELGFALTRPEWGRGLMLEAVARLLNFAFGSLGLARLEADVDPRNFASLRLLERLGFRREGLLRERWRVAGEVQDSVLLGLLAREHPAGSARPTTPAAGTNAIVVRAARLPDETPRIKQFINGLQAVEYAVQPDRRVDDTVAEEYLAVLLRTVAERDGRILVAEVGGDVAGWMVTHVIEDAVYVRPEDRTFGYIAELFVEETYRRRGVARAMFAVAEADFATRAIPTVEINVLNGNTAVRATYEALGYRPYSSAMRKRL